MIRKYLTIFFLACSGFALVGDLGAAVEPGNANAETIVSSEDGLQSLSASDTYAAAEPQNRAGYVLVVKGETLWSIASRYKDDDHSVAQVVIAFLRANPGAFIDGNINNMQAGVMLRIPDRDELDAIGRQEAYAEVSRQNALWKEYLARVGGVSPEAADDREELSGELSLLLPGDVDGEATGSGDPGELNELRTRLAMAEEELEVSRTENEELESSIAELEAKITMVEELQVMLDEPASESMEAESAAQEEGEFDDYLVELGIEGKLEIPGDPGELIVRIGKPGNQTGFPEGFVSDSTRVPAELGAWARIEPQAPAFEIEPSVSACIKIHPSGSEYSFILTPAKGPGSYIVSANVSFHDTDDCARSAVTKKTARLEVRVEVNYANWTQAGMAQLGLILWEKFKVFWAALIALIFGLLLFLVRKNFKRRFGFEEK